jgi:urease subunit beta
MIPGEYLLRKEPVVVNAGRKTALVHVVNTGDRPVQIGSHFHFFEVNSALSFERSLAFGMRLDIASGTAVRFEPGEQKQVQLVEYGGKKRMVGFNNLANSGVGEAEKALALERAVKGNFKITEP